MNDEVLELVVDGRDAAVVGAVVAVAQSRIDHSTLDHIPVAVGSHHGCDSGIG